MKKDSAEMIDRFDYLYSKMVESQKTKNMQIFGQSAREMFVSMANDYPDMAEDWLTKLEAICWRNYLSEKEAYNISKHVINQNGEKGFHWRENVFNAVLDKFGVDKEKQGIYNSYALYVMVNVIYSDHARSIAEDLGVKSLSDVDDEKMAKSCYRKAIELLEDPDETFMIRTYFKDYMV